MKKQLLGFMLLVSCASFAQAQTVVVRFAPTYGGAALQLNHQYALSDGDSISFEALRFYISDLQLIQGAQKVADLAPRHKLVDLDDPATQTITFTSDKAIAFDKIVFNLGIDSLTNVSGALGGDLDPTKGMYWAWQSGYINLKLEGIASACPARNHRFQFHLGGYLPPYLGLQRVELPVKNAGDAVVIDLPIDVVLAEIDFQAVYEVMRPSGRAVDLAKLFAASFKLVE